MSYSTVETRYKGNPVLEVLRDGQPIQLSYDAHFRFGLAKAKLILSAQEFLEVFVHSKGSRPAPGDIITVVRSGLGVTCTVRKFSQFTYSTGEVKRKPYIELRTEGCHIGLGQIKADAAIAVTRDIRRFVEKHAGASPPDDLPF